jgi:hypothetical protein
MAHHAEDGGGKHGLQLRHGCCCFV